MRASFLASEHREVQTSGVKGDAVTEERRNDLVRYGASRTGMYDPVDYTRTYPRSTAQTGAPNDADSDRTDTATLSEIPTPQEPA